MTKADRWNERYAASDLVWSAGPNARFAEEVAGLTPGRALDLGCGEGRNSLWLAEQGWRCTAVDFASAGLDKVRAIAAKRGVTVDCVLADLGEWQAPAGGFDLVFALYLHTSPAERSHWLAQAVAAVKPGGTFLYLGHDPANIEHGIGGPQDPGVLPTAQDISAALAGFDILKANVIERPLSADPGHSAPGQEGVALDTLVVATRR